MTNSKVNETLSLIELKYNFIYTVLTFQSNNWVNWVKNRNQNRADDWINHMLGGSSLESHSWLKIYSLSVRNLNEQIL